MGKTANQNRLLEIALVVCMLLPAATAVAVEADAGLLRLVGEDAGLVIEVAGLSDELPRFETCEVFRRLQQTTVYRQWKASNDFRKLIATKTVIEQFSGKPLKQFVDDVFGRSIVLAVYPRGTNATQTVLITRASGSQVLESAVAAWNRADRSELTRVEFEGYEYVRRARSKPGGKSLPPQFYVRFGDILAFSDNEPAIRRVIVLHAAAATSSPNDRDDLKKATFRRHFLLSPAQRAAHEALTRKRFVSLYLNPRAWDDRLHLDADKSTAAVFLSNVWRQCDSIAFALYVDKRGVFVEGLAHYEGWSNEPGVQLPSESEETDAVPAFLIRVPRRAIAAFAGKHDLASVARVLIDWIPDRWQDDWHRVRQLSRGLLVGFDVFDDVLPALGQNWGAYVVASSKEAAGRSPLDAVVGVELPPPGDVARGDITLRDGLDNALETTLRLVASFWNSQATGTTSAVKTATTRPGLPIRSIKAGKSLRPAYALTANHLVAGTSPQALEEFIGLDASNSLGMDPAFRDAAQRYFPTGDQLLYVNVAALRRVIGEHKSLLSTRLADSKAVSPAASKRRVGMLNDLLRACDMAFIAVHTDGRRIRLISGVTANPPGDDANR